MTLLAFSGYSALLPTAPLWALQGGAGTDGSGLVNGVLMLFTVLTQPVVPAALRRFGWGPVLIAGVLLLGLPSPVHLLSDSAVPTLALSAVRGLGFGVVTVCGSAAVAQLVAPASRGRAIGIFGLAIAAPQLALMPAAPWVADNLGFGVIFTVGALPVLAVVPAARLARCLDAVPATGSHGRPAYRRLVPPMLILLGVTLAGGAIISFLAQMSSDATLTMGGLFLLTLTAALSRWRVGGLADFHGPRPFMIPLVVLTAAGLALIAWAVRDPAATAALALLGGCAILGISYGGLQNLTLLASMQKVRRRHYSQASAVWNIGFDAGTGAGSVLVGVVATGSSFSTALLVCAAISLATLPLALRRPTPSAPGG